MHVYNLKAIPIQITKKNNYEEKNFFIYLIVN